MSPQRASRAEKAAGDKETSRGLRFAGERYRDRIPRERRKTRHPTGPNLTKEALSRYDPAIA